MHTGSVWMDWLLVGTSCRSLPGITGLAAASLVGEVIDAGKSLISADNPVLSAAIDITIRNSIVSVLITRHSGSGP